MSVKNIVKVMNFHSLLRVNSARRKVEEAHEYENELRDIILSIVNNRIFKEEKLSLRMPTDKEELNIYIGSDWGFCANFNSDIINFLKEDNDKNDKIIIGKKINFPVKNVLLYIDKEMFTKDSDKIYDIVLDGVLNSKYSKINIVYIHYYNLNHQEVVKKSILPLDINENEKSNRDDDYAVEGDLFYIIWNLVSIYVSTEIKIAEAWSWASENVKRQAFTSESLDKIEEREVENSKIIRKERNKKSFDELVENTNRKITKKKKEA